MFSFSYLFCEQAAILWGVAKQLAIKTISVIEGAMMNSIAIEDNSVLDQAIIIDLI